MAQRLFSNMIIFVWCLFVYGTISHTVDCNINSCSKTNINCPQNEDCWIYCDAASSCKQSIIMGPINGALNIFCNAEKSCFDAVFDGSESSKVSITGCTETESCLDISLYCPSNRNNNIGTMKNCFFEGNDNLGDTKIYAINGWNDIDINYSGSYGPDHGGKMYCNDNYGTSCNIASDKWSCINDNDCRSTPQLPSYPDIIGKLPNNNISILQYPSSTPQSTASLTNDVYISTTSKDKDGTKTTSSAITTSSDSSEEAVGGGYDKSKMSGISGWSLLTRLLFGAGALILIIIVGIGCYYTHKNKMPDHHPTHIKPCHSVPSWQSTHGNSSGHSAFGHSGHSGHSGHRHSAHSQQSHHGHHAHSGHRRSTQTLHHGNEHKHKGHPTTKQYSVTTTKDVHMDHMENMEMVSRTPTPTNCHKDSDSLINNDYVHNNNNKTTEVIRFI